MNNDEISKLNKETLDKIRETEKLVERKYLNILEFLDELSMKGYYKLNMNHKISEVYKDLDVLHSECNKSINYEIESLNLKEV